MDIFSKYNKADLLIPLLLSFCEKNPTDSDHCQLLFNAYISKLSKLNYKLKNEKKHLSNVSCSSDKIKQLLNEKEMLEYELK